MLSSASSLGKNIQVLTEHLPPYQIAHTDGSVTGSHTDIVRDVFALANLSYGIHANSWTVSYQQALKDPNVCIYSIAKIPTREPLFYWIGYLTSIPTYFYSLASKNIQLTSFEDAYKYKAAALEDDVSLHYLLGRGFELEKNIFPVSDRDNLFSILIRRSDTVDLLMLSDNLFQQQVRAIGKKRMIKKHDNFVAMQMHYYLACSLATSPEYVIALKQAMQRVTSDNRN